MIGLDHFVWFPVEGSGYQETASGSSKKINPKHFKSWFKEFLPVFLSHSQEEAYLIFNKSQSPFLLLTRIGYTEDEIGRDAPMHHSAVVHKKLLEEEKLSLFDVRDSLAEFDKKHQRVEGELERLKVPEKESQDFAYKDELKTLLTPAAVKSLTYRLLKSKRNRVILRCEGSKETERFKIAAYLVKLLSIDFDIRAASVTTIRPRDKYCNLFDLAVTEKTFTPPRHTENWSYVEWDLDEFEKGKPKDKKLKKAFERIDQDFIYDIGEYIEDSDSPIKDTSETDRGSQEDQKKLKK